MSLVCKERLYTNQEEFVTLLLVHKSRRIYDTWVSAQIKKKEFVTLVLIHRSITDIFGVSSKEFVEC